MWKVAMNTEMKSLKDNDVWDLLELPSGRKKVGSKWVFKMKTSSDGKNRTIQSKTGCTGIYSKVWK